MTGEIEDLIKTVENMDNYSLVLEFDKLQTLWDTAKELRDADPKKALRILAILSLKARGLPETWKETTSEIYQDTNLLITKIGGSDYIFFLQVAELSRLENKHLAAAHHYKQAADALGRDGFKVMKVTYNGTDDLTERIRYLREAVTSFQAGGDGDLASQCHVEAMHLKTQQVKGYKRWWLRVGWLLWGWGERPLHVVASASVAIALYAIGYMICGIKPTDGSRWEQILNPVYLSVITFSTVGYGDVSPGSSFSKLLAASEGLVGIFFTGLFLVTFVKRSTR